MITAKIIADSVSNQGVRITTMQLRYPKFIHGEFMTHRMFSRNASSSRAIPVERLIKDVMDDPAMPIHWGKNQKGMQAREECNEIVEFQHFKHTREEAWLRARDLAIAAARSFHAAGYHKQIVNRIIEPWCHINVVVTATEWSNFFHLRCHPDAQPEMRMLAEAMREAMDNSTPINDNRHLPYIAEDERHVVFHRDIFRDILTRLSVARCARVSYLTQEGKKPAIAEDLALYDRLMGAQPLHASPAEHQAESTHPDTWSGNFRGWVQFRKTLDGECM